MKIAVLLVGHLRTWDQCKENFINYIQDENHEVHVYIHTHDRIYNSMNISFNEKLKHNKMSIDMLSGINIRSLIIEPENTYLNYYKNINNIFDICYGIYSPALKLKNCNLIKNLSLEQYDLVVKTRPDIKLHSKLNYNDLINKPDNIISVGKVMNTGAGTPDDIIAVGKPHIMDLYCNRIDLGIESSIETKEEVRICSHNTLKILSSLYSLNYDHNIEIDIVRPT